ncbi:pleckstrin homology domain-containing family G member 4B isoform X4 [Rhea pennata]|uniref:pleckstrin homology domain-containing family G member 4B isoform X4 n=1 Tax=Rhea pennata TaxID=8795 RepID=UPI002E27751D
MNPHFPAPKARGDSYLSIKDSKSLDTYIQNALSALYPPFEATAATVLWQLFNIVEKLYQGDGLRCLIDFLVPAKRALQCIQRETCAKYAGLIFYHEGWPLCIHEKVVIQLASLHRVRLKPGDFYLQVVPTGKQLAKLVLKCLSRCGQGMEEVAIPETMYDCIFTETFLENLNCERENFPLKSCLLTTGTAVYRTPWKNIINPIFVPTTETILCNYSSNLLDQLISNHTDVRALTQTMESNSSCDSSTSNDTGSTVIEASGTKCHSSLDSAVLSSAPASESSLAVECCKAPDEKIKDDSACLSVCSEAWSSMKDRAAGPEKDLVNLKDEALLPLVEKKSYTKSITFNRDLSRSCSTEQERRDSSFFEARRLFRKSYIEALQNPMNVSFSSEESFAEEEISDHLVDSCAVNEGKTHEKQAEKRDFLSGRLIPKDEMKEGTNLAGSPLAFKKLLVSPETLSTVDCKAGPRHSGSLDRARRGPHVADQRPDKFLHDVSGGNPKKLLNGCVSRPGKLDSVSFSTTVRSHKHSKGEEGFYQQLTAINSKNSFQRGEDSIAVYGSPILFHREHDLLSANTRTLCDRLPKQLLEINQELLQSGVISLCGNRDRSGRAVIQVCTRHAIWLNEHCTSTTVAHLLMYLFSIPRKEVRGLGVVILVDARKCQPNPSLFKALTGMQNVIPHSIHSVLVLTDKEYSFRPDRDITIQYEILTSLKTLNKLIDHTQLTAEFDGTFHYNHSDWICFRRKLEPFIANCKEAIVFLQNAVSSLTANRTLNTVQDVCDLISKHKTMMKLVLEDALLVTLRLEGGTVLARLRKEIYHTEDYQDAMEIVTRLYNQVDEEVHRLVLLSNKCLQQLETLGEARKFEEGCDQIKQWFENEREKYLGCLDQEGLSLEKVRKLQEDFQGFIDKMKQYYQKGLQLVQENHSLNMEEKVQIFKKYLSNIFIQTEKRKTELTKLVNLYEFYEMAQEWMLHCNECLSHLTAEARYSPSAIQCLETYHLEGELEKRNWNSEDIESISSTCSASFCSEPIHSPPTYHRKQPHKKIMKKTQNFELSQHEGNNPEFHHHGYPGVHIKGLEVASNNANEKKYMQCLNSRSPLISRNRSLSSPSRIHHMEEEDRKRGGSNKVQHIMDEMIATEREYVRSLGYIINNYFPEMERIDLPQDLRGKRNTIFGNLEKLYDFHCQYFLKELERCRDFPLCVSHCFLKHEEQFGMYALYSKNKPQSDALLTSHGNAFFKNKQRNLGDKMDLASYLLKPIQRMSKYALLLKDMIKECTKTQEQELSDLRAAEEMVKFQLRHGNDLLAMDAIQGCDVNLKEQGQLRCQDEFIVCCGRKKYLRHVFLFEDLILFSKTKKIDGGYDIYMYKQSFKTAEIGMTENVGDSGLRFEIWFRRRRRSQDTYILQANSAEIKTAWTDIIGKILWRQAMRNRELRIQEMVSMGIGNKPFMDIKPSEAAISNRAIDYLMKGTESRSRASIAVSSFDHSTPFKRPHSTISSSSTSSSGSQSSSSILGSLNLHVCSSQSHSGLLGLPFYHWSYDVRNCIEEDELEQETGSQPSMITESSESSQCTSGESLSGFSTSAHSESHLPTETFLDEGISSAISKYSSQCMSPVLPEKNSRSKHNSQYVTAL